MTCMVLCKSCLNYITLSPLNSFHVALMISWWIWNKIVFDSIQNGACMLCHLGKCSSVSISLYNKDKISNKHKCKGNVMFLLFDCSTVVNSAHCLVEYKQNMITKSSTILHIISLPFDNRLLYIKIVHVFTSWIYFWFLYKFSKLSTN